MAQQDGHCRHHGRPNFISHQYSGDGAIFAPSTGVFSVLARLWFNPGAQQLGCPKSLFGNRHSIASLLSPFLSSRATEGSAVTRTHLGNVCLHNELEWGSECFYQTRRNPWSASATIERAFMESSPPVNRVSSITGDVEVLMRRINIRRERAAGPNSALGRDTLLSGNRQHPDRIDHRRGDCV